MGNNMPVRLVDTPSRPRPTAEAGPSDGPPRPLCNRGGRADCQPGGLSGRADCPDLIEPQALEAGRRGWRAFVRASSCRAPATVGVDGGRFLSWHGRQDGLAVGGSQGSQRIMNTLPLRAAAGDNSFASKRLRQRASDSVTPGSRRHPRQTTPPGSQIMPGGVLRMRGGPHPIRATFLPPLGGLCPATPFFSGIPVWPIVGVYGSPVGVYEACVRCQLRSYGGTCLSHGGVAGDRRR